MKIHKHHRRQRRVYSEELKQEVVQMLRDGHSAFSVAHKTTAQHPFG
jgi:hypothetical protein